MITDYINEDGILTGVRGTVQATLGSLAARLELPYTGEEITDNPEAGFALLEVGSHTAIPHLRDERLTRSHVALAILPVGSSFRGRLIHVILFVASPMEDTSEQLMLVEKFAALLPDVEPQLMACQTPAGALRVLELGENRVSHPSFINLPAERVARELGTDLSLGLSEAEAERRFGLYGPNAIERTRRTPLYFRMIKNFFSFFAILLWLAAGLCFVPGVDMPQLGVAILIVVVINGIFAFFQEERSDRAVEALQRLVAPRCRVIRDGEQRDVEGSSLVPGDLILLSEGDVVPADARLIEADGLEIDNSSLTGESTSSRRYKSDSPVLIEGKFLWIELPNVVFGGSAVLKGSGRGLVFGTGMGTEIGQIARLTLSIKAEESPLQKQLRGTVYSIAALASALGLTFLLVGWLGAGLSFAQAFIFFIGIFVANVPEGLLPTVTLALAMGVSRMAKRNAIVKNLSSVETLGCTTVICSDKTGTLTQNVMMVESVLWDGHIIEVRGSGYSPEGEFIQDGKRLSTDDIVEREGLRQLIQCAYICNNATLEKKGGEWMIHGDPTEGSLMTLARRAGVRGAHTRIHTNPFESIRKRMSVLATPGPAGERALYAKGAPLELLACCNRLYHDGKICALTDEHRRSIVSQNDRYATAGYRVLALAFRDTASLEGVADYSVETLERDLIFLGLAAMSDPVREAVPAAIEACHTAGIRVIMITGDYPLTAASIGRKAGLGKTTDGQDALRAFTGTELEQMNDEDLLDHLRQGEIIFARVTPDQKLRIVTLLQQMGEIVAVTGDGVNDGPALKRADIGIAMGMRGTEVAKEAAHIVLTDDNFASIVAAIEEGRGIFENIKRFVAYVLNSNPQEMYPYILWMLIPGFPLAMTVMGVLAVDVGTDLIPAMGLGIERPEKGIMKRPPRARGERLLSLSFILRSYFVHGSILALSCFATYYFCGWYSGWWHVGSVPRMPASPPGLDMNLATAPYLVSLTAYFFPTVAVQIANVLSKRSWSASLFSRDFLPPERRREILEGLRAGRRTGRGALAGVPMAAIAVLFERNYFLMNLFSNPLINAGIVFELFLCYLFFYTDLSGIYYFAPAPVAVYAFAFSGTAVMLGFEEGKKWLRRRGMRLDFLG